MVQRVDCTSVAASAFVFTVRAIQENDYAEFLLETGFEEADALIERMRSST